MMLLLLIIQVLALPVDTQQGASLAANPPQATALAALQAQASAPAIDQPLPANQTPPAVVVNESELMAQDVTDASSFPSVDSSTSDMVDGGMAGASVDKAVAAQGIAANAAVSTPMAQQAPVSSTPVMVANATVVAPIIAAPPVNPAVTAPVPVVAPATTNVAAIVTPSPTHAAIIVRAATIGATTIAATTAPVAIVAAPTSAAVIATAVVLAPANAAIAATAIQKSMALPPTSTASSRPASTTATIANQLPRADIMAMNRDVDPASLVIKVPTSSVTSPKATKSVTAAVSGLPVHMDAPGLKVFEGVVGPPFALPAKN